MERKVIVVAGPTCSGKSKLGFDLANKLNGEIISADSRQFYKYLNIGTAKPSLNELQKVKHHLIDFLDPAEDYNVNKFENQSIKIIKELFNKNIQPIVVGGSGLYIKALIDGIFDEVDTDEIIRKELLEKRKNFGNEYLYEELKKVDPDSAAKMHPQNWKRVIRAIEVFNLTGQPIWMHQKNHKRNIDIKFLQFGLIWDRDILYKKIEDRVDAMIKSGLVEEVKNILKMGFGKNLNALNTVGYKEIISYLNEEITLERAIELIKRNTRRYAKRQLTWFNKDKRINWISLNNDEDFDKCLNIIMKEMANQNL